MLTQSSTAIYVDMGKALTELASDKPSAKTDMQIFLCMANWANRDGMVDMRTSDIAATVQRVTTAYIHVLAAVAEAYAKKYDDLAGQLDDIAANIKKATSNN